MANSKDRARTEFQYTFTKTKTHINIRISLFQNWTGVMNMKSTFNGDIKGQIYLRDTANLVLRTKACWKNAQESQRNVQIL